MLRGLRNRSASRRSPVSSEEDEEYGRNTSKQHKAITVNHNSHKHYAKQPSSNHNVTRPMKESRSNVSLSSSSDGSLLSSIESQGVDYDTGNNLSHDTYLDDKTPDLEEILRSFGSKSRKLSNTGVSRRNDKSKFKAKQLSNTNTDDLYDDDRDSNDSSYNSGFSSSSDSSFESIPDTTQIAAFYNGLTETQSPAVANTIVTLSPTSATDVAHFGAVPIDENVPCKLTSNRLRQHKERRRKSRTSKDSISNQSANAHVVVDHYEDDNRSRQSFLSRTNSLINTSKSFGKNWTRKKRIDQVVNLSDDETKEKLLVLIDVNPPTVHKEFESMVSPPVDQEIMSVSTITTCETESLMIASNEAAALISISIKKNNLSNVIERFDCDTGALVTNKTVDSHADSSSKRSSSPTLSPDVVKKGHPVDPLSLRNINQNAEHHNSDNESPQQKSCGSSGEPIVNYSISNAANVIENMVLLFARSDVEGIRRLLGESLESSVSSLSTTSSTLSRDKALDDNSHNNDNGLDGEDDLSDGKGGSDKQEAKHLRAKKLLVDQKSRYKQPSKSLQSQYLSNDYTLPLSMRGIVTHYSISILLIEPVNKLFEIVTVDVTRNTSLKETLTGACMAASDLILSEQVYISLCSDEKVLTNMTSPVSKLIQKPTSPPGGHGKENVQSSDNKVALENNEKQRDTAMRREMERQLLVAVPSKSNFKECQMIRRILWKNTKLQLWWRTYQMKNEHYDTPWSIAN